MRTYSDVQLAAAVAESHSWRGVLRALGLSGTSSGAARSVRLQADRLGLDYSQFRGQRRWSDDQLRDAVSDSTSWTEVADRLGLAGGSSTTTLRGHAVRLGLDLRHFTPAAPAGIIAMHPCAERLPRAGNLIAAAWYELCGWAVSWPLEPQPYDLIAAEGPHLRRVQVKTTRHRVGRSWRVKLASHTRTSGTYDPADVDDLFVVAADRSQYVIPFERVAGLSEITLSAYRSFTVPPF